MESNFPAELGNAYRAMENQGNPWGMNQGERGDWADGLDGVTVVDPGETAAVRVPLLGRLRRLVRRQEQEGHPGDGPAAAPGRHRRRHPRPVRDVHRRLRPPLGQRVPVPDARPAERRDAQRHGREEDHHPVPALLQHAAQRVPADRRELRGHPPHAAARAADRQRPARRQPGHARGAHHLPRLVLPRSPQRRVPRAAQGRRLDQGHRGRRDAAQRHQGHVLRRRRRPHVDGGDRRHEGQRRACRRGDLHRRQPGRHRLPVLLHHARRRREGCRGTRRTRCASPTSRSTCSRRSRPARPSSSIPTHRWPTIAASAATDADVRRGRRCRGRSPEGRAPGRARRRRRHVRGRRHAVVVRSPRPLSRSPWRRRNRSPG